MGAVTVKVDSAGRVVIPKEMRQELGIPDGGELRLTVEDGELRGFTLAYLVWNTGQEEGGDVVLRAVASGLPVLLSAVNLAEAIGILHRRRGLPSGEASAEILSLGLEVVAFDAEQAQEIGSLEPLLRNKGIAFGDRACLMLGRVRSLPVLTADRPWAGLDLGVEVRLIR